MYLKIEGESYEEEMSRRARNAGQYGECGECGVPHYTECRACFDVYEVAECPKVESEQWVFLAKCGPCYL